MKKKKLDYDAKVKEAKNIMTLLRLSNQHRMKVAAIACEVCVILHGGRAPVARYGLKKFSVDIGLNDHTLYEWVRVYRYMYSKITDEQKEDFHKFPSNLLRPTLKGLSESATPAFVQKKFAAAISQGRGNNKMLKYIQHLNGVIYNVSNHSRMLEVNDKMLLEMHQKASLIRGYIEQELNVRKYPKNKIVKQPKIDMTKFWHDDVGVEVRA